jgi:methylated-DNA-[protein]-cysteine S-methyltransferase
MTDACIVGTPVGRVRIEAARGAITVLAWTDEALSSPSTDLLRSATKQLEEYFAGSRERFDLPLAPSGTDHQKKVWQAMCDIPQGALRTYGDIADEIGSSARAVGTACGKNPIPIIVPCHRIVAAGGGIGGYSGRGGTATKRQLLDLEGVRLDRQASLDLEAPNPGR